VWETEKDDNGYLELLSSCRLAIRRLSCSRQAVARLGIAR